MLLLAASGWQRLLKLKYVLFSHDFKRILTKFMLKLNFWLRYYLVLNVSMRDLYSNISRLDTRMNEQSLVGYREITPEDQSRKNGAPNDYA